LPVLIAQLPPDSHWATESQTSACAGAAKATDPPTATAEVAMIASRRFGVWFMVFLSSGIPPAQGRPEDVAASA
jgi:hypothetical protein